MYRPSTYANWDPPNQIQVGDFGNINRETGEFEKEGNVYTHPDSAELAAGAPPVTAAQETSLTVASRTVKRRELSLGADFIAGLAEALIKGRWDFGAKRGALLIIARPRSSYIPHDTLLARLIGIPVLAGKSLVRQVIACPAYSLYLSNATNEIIDVALLGKIPLAPMISAGGGFEATWWTQNTTGLFREALDDTGADSYTPLYTLKRIPKPGLLRRESPVPELEGDDLWVDTMQPWEPLDDDGEEMVFEDTVFE